ncbi:MAG: F0F1 ATP synthase subunit B [Bacteroidales bacterium]|nr:F0F1 ATP synthase subunit B [Bacteroidales bacterium]
MSLITPDFGLLFWMTLIFAVVFFILAKFGFPVITGMVEKRSDRIDESLRKAEEADKAIAELTARGEKIISDAQAEQARILREASATSDSIVAKARDEAKEEAAKILQQARTDIAAEKESALRDIRRVVANMSVEVAEKVLRTDLDEDKKQDAYLDRLIEEVQRTQDKS